MRNRLRQPKPLKPTDGRSEESGLCSSPLLTPSTLVSPKPPNLRSNPNEGKQAQPSLLYRKPTGTNFTKSTSTESVQNSFHSVGEKNEKDLSRRVSPVATVGSSLQKEIKTATQFALKIVQNYRDRKSAENDAWSLSPTCYKPTIPPSSTPDILWQSQTLTFAREKSESDDWETTDMSESGLGSSRNERTPKKRDVQDFFKTSQKYGDSIIKMLKNDGFEQSTPVVPEGQSLVSTGENRPKIPWDERLKSTQGIVRPLASVRKLRRMSKVAAGSPVCDASAAVSSNTTPTKGSGSKLKRTFAKAKFILKTLQNDK